MEINHIDGSTVNTNNLNDVDAILMEESAKLYKLFSKYNRQLVLLGEMKATEQGPSEVGCIFFNVDSLDCDKEDLPKKVDKFILRVDRFLYQFSNGQLRVARVSESPSE